MFTIGDTTASIKGLDMRDSAAWRASTVELLRIHPNPRSLSTSDRSALQNLACRASPQKPFRGVKSTGLLYYGGNRLGQGLGQGRS